MPPQQAFTILRSRPHGHVAAIVGTMRRLELDRVVARRPSRQRTLVLGMIAARLIAPASKLATARGFDPRTQHSTLGEVLGLESASADDLYEAIDWLRSRQGKIETALARRHLGEGALVLYDVTSVVYEGKTCPLVRWGHPRDGRRGKPQLLVGVVTNVEGCPVAVEVFHGNAGDPTTLAPQVSRVRQRFGFHRMVVVGDRGMLTEARLREELAPAQLDWITALRAPQIRQLVEGGALQLSLFDQRDLAEITSSDYPGERLVVCRNPLLVEERTRKREALLQATEQELETVAQATRRAHRPLRGREQIALRVGRVLHRFKVGKHFRWEITDETFTYERDSARIAQEAALDGIYVIRCTSCRRGKRRRGGARLQAPGCRGARLPHPQGPGPADPPIYHRLEERVRGHVLLCLVAYYVEWHMRQCLAPLLFDDDDKAAADALRQSVVAPARRSPRARRKAQTKQTADGLPVHSFRTLLLDLATLTKNQVQWRLPVG